ncbi:MAG: ATP-dependent DNA helicase RecG, partial [Fimbriimonadaceae bacterium]|nr:ATP-dependent DNA helicase RecG [Fimbriimonadaceae bacterium]
YVKGVGPKLAPLFSKLGIETARDLLFHFPRRYEDRRHLPPIREARPGNHVTVRGMITHVESRPTRGRAAPVKCILNDGTGQIVLVWFNQPWIAKKLRETTGEIIAYGLVKDGGHACEIHSPEWEVIDPDEEADGFTRIVPVYGLTESLMQRSVRRVVSQAINSYADLLEETLPVSIRKAQGLPGVGWAVRRMHQPESPEDIAQARHRIAFDEFLAIQLMVQMRRAATQQEPGIKFEWGGNLKDELPQILPFELTGAQQRVVREIWGDMRKGHPMNRLVQGDVGSGKTAVAACAILAAARSGYQSALMAPTEILAEQHAMSLARLFEPLGLKVQLMLGKQKATEKRRAIEQIESGAAQVIVGTHAIIQEGVNFAKLGLVIIDEQHRFGVLQRLALRQKSDLVPNVLVMTATPIPRTLSMTVYGDLDVSVIDEMPPGRKPIKTHWKMAKSRETVYESVSKLLTEGRQAYFVCPMITESEKLQTQAAVDLRYRLSSGAFSEFRVGLLHGQMKPAEKESVMDLFRKHELDVLVSTVVIEVGVDVPNATVMVIEDANRFGLSQLHQIRGRVGRGDQQSYCILIADATTDEARDRLEVMVSTQDGFKIAEEDMRLRGPGDMLGTRQSGNLDLRVADLIQDLKVLEEAKQVAADIIATDPHLERAENVRLRSLLRGKREADAWLPVT